jgi:hypothetical protein
MFQNIRKKKTSFVERLVTLNCPNEIGSCIDSFYHLPVENGISDRIGVVLDPAGILKGIRGSTVLCQIFGGDFSGESVASEILVSVEARRHCADIDSGLHGGLSAGDRLDCSRSGEHTQVVLKGISYFLVVWNFMTNFQWMSKVRSYLLS